MHLAKIHELPVEPYDLNSNDRIDVGDAVKIFMGLAKMIEKQSIDFEWDEKVYLGMPTDVNEKFAGGCVFITLDKSIRINENKTFDGLTLFKDSYFDTIEIEDMSDLYKISELFEFKTPKKTRFTEGYERQSVMIQFPCFYNINEYETLERKQEALDAANFLIGIDGIYSVSVNAIYKIGI